MLTVGKVTSKISELRSKIAITDGLITYLAANYLSSDAGEAEMKFLRDDYATVHNDHIESYIEGLHDMIAQLKAELEHWENLTVPVVAPAQRAEDDETEAEHVAKAATAKGRKAVRESKQQRTRKSEAGGQHQGDPASEDDQPEGAG